jgi:SAM-dependent methyltransferase
MDDTGGGWEQWQWDETLFVGSAAYYQRGRLPYSPGLADAFTSLLSLDGRGRLLDVGCGPGTVALLLSKLFEEVVGLDPDADMLREARRIGAERQIANASWVQLRAEELPHALGAFLVVTFAASFHWMDRLLVARTVKDMLDPEGVVVHVDNRHQDSLAPGPEYPAPPRDRIDALRRAYLGADRRAGRSIRNSSPDNEAQVFREAGFVGPEITLVPDGRVLTRTVDDIVAETFSVSSTAPHLFGPRLSEFESDLRRELLESSPQGLFSVRLPDNELKVWSPARR